MKGPRSLGSRLSSVSLADSLWPRVERRLSEELGMVLESLGELGRARDNRVTWAAAGEGVGETIVKARF